MRPKLGSYCVFADISLSNSARPTANIMPTGKLDIIFISEFSLLLIISNVFRWSGNVNQECLMRNRENFCD